MLGKKRLYMDFAAATPLHRRAFKEMRRGFRAYGNPGAPHAEGRLAKKLLEEARVRIARTLFVKPDTLTFTGSGTEANNLAIFGVIEALIRRGAKPEDLHVITSGFEHPSLGDPVAALTRRGVSVSLVQPDEYGIITPQAVEKLIRPETTLISIVAVQSEIGTIQPLKDIARMLEPFRKKREQNMQSLAPEAFFPVFHSDASQTPLFANLTPERLGVDMATYDGQKVMGPKGIGTLYRTLSVPLEPIMRGGKQERGLRPGTENVAGALGMAVGMELAQVGREGRIKRVAAVRDYLAERLAQEIPGIEINGSMKHRIANNLNVSVPNADGDYLAVLLDKEGIAISPRSACIASGTPSRTVAALGKEAQAASTLRFSLAPSTTRSDVERAVQALNKVLASEAVQF
jgi:cysteine desulfurase